MVYIKREMRSPLTSLLIHTWLEQLITPWQKQGMPGDAQDIPQIPGTMLVFCKLRLPQEGDMRELVRPRKQLQPAAVPEHSSCSNTWLDADVSALMLVISPHSQLRHTPACQLLAFLSKRGRWLHSQAFVLLHRGGGRTGTAVQQQLQNLEVIANSSSSIDTPALHSSYMVSQKP